MGTGDAQRPSGLILGLTGSLGRLERKRGSSMKEQDRPQPISYTTEYGVIEIAAEGYRRSEGGWFRYDRFTPHDPGSAFGGKDSIFALGDRDVSPQHRGY